MYNPCLKCTPVIAQVLVVINLFHTNPKLPWTFVTPYKDMYPNLTELHKNLFISYFNFRHLYDKPLIIFLITSRTVFVYITTVQYIKKINILILQICCNSHCFRFCLFFFFFLFFFPHSSFYYHKQDVARRMRTVDRRLQAVGTIEAFPRVLADQIYSKTVGFWQTPN